MTPARLVAAATLAALAATAPSFAAGFEPERTRLGFDVGHVSIGAGSFDRGAAQYNLRVGTELGRTLEAEIGLSGAKAEESLLPGVSRRVDYVILSANAVFNFHPRPSVSPYLLFGFGLGRLRFEAIGLSTSDTATAIQAAAGCRWDVGKSRRSAIRLEASVGSLQRLTWSSDEREGGTVRTVAVSLGYVHVVRDRAHAPVRARP